MYGYFALSESLEDENNGICQIWYQLSNLKKKKFITD